MADRYVSRSNERNRRNKILKKLNSFLLRMSVINNLPPKTAFWSGFAGGILVVMAVGFLVTLPMVLKGGGLGGLARGGDDTVIAPQPAATPAGRVAGADTGPQPGQLPPAGNVKPVTKADHIKGDFSKAKVFLIEYSDIECPFCKRFHPTMKQTVQTYGKDVAWVYRHFPLNFHANAQKEAEASECAAELGGNTAFWKYLDTMFERTTSGGTGFALDKLTPLAKEIGLNETKFQQCLDSGRYTAKVNQDLQEGQTAGVNGTPGTVLLTRDGQTAVISGAVPFETVKSAVEKYLK